MVLRLENGAVVANLCLGDPFWLPLLATFA